MESSPTSDRLISILAGLFIAAFFLLFTWRGLLVYFSYDDLLNLYTYWSKPYPFAKSLVFFWAPYYRPVGGIVYRTLFATFGLNPHPLYALYFALLLLNLWLAYLLLARLSGSRETGAIAVLLWAFHGKLASLYYSAGALFDVLCFLFYSLALAIYLRARTQDRLPGLWGTLGFLACLIGALDSKEMAVTLPVMVLIYELLFHPPKIQLRALTQWCMREGRTALLGGLCVMIYMPARLAPGGLAHDLEYIPTYTWSRWIEDTGTYLAYVIYHNHPLAPWAVGVFYAILIAVAFWSRSRVVWFGVLFVPITMLPVSFIPPRLGFVLYLPLAGLALAAASAFMRVKEILVSRFPAGFSPRTASIAFFLLAASLMAGIDYHFAPPAPRAWFSPEKKAMDQIPRLYPSLPRGSTLLFVHTPLDDGWALVFLLRLYYRDNTLFITQLYGPPEQRIPLDQLPHYDHIFDFENGSYVELDNADSLRSIQPRL